MPTKTKAERAKQRKDKIAQGDYTPTTARKRKKKKKRPSPRYKEPELTSGEEQDDGEPFKQRADRRRKPAHAAELPSMSVGYERLKKEELVIVWIPLTNLHTNPANPNVQTDKEFNTMVALIEKEGFKDPMRVGPITDEADERYKAPGKKREAVMDGRWPVNQQFEMVAGEHRLDVLRLLNKDGEWDLVPCIVDVSLKTQDQRDLSLVRDNVVGGQLDDQKLTAMYERLIAKFGHDEVREGMGFSSDEAMQDYIVEMEAMLPDEETKEQFRKEVKKKKVKTIEDLSRIINTIFTKYGNTTELSFMNFEFGGHTHCVVWMDRATKNLVEEITSFAIENELDINPIMQTVLAKGWDETTQAILEDEAKFKSKEPSAADTAKDLLDDDDDDEFE